MNSQKSFNFFKKILYSSFFLWLLLIFFEKLNLKPEININLFFFLALILFLILFLEKILIFLILSLNKINFYLNLSKKISKINLLNDPHLFFIFIIQLLKFLKGFPIFLKVVFTNYLFWLILGIFGVFLDIFVFKFTSYLLILFLNGLWILLIYHFKFKNKASVKLAFGFLILCPFLLIFKKELIAEKAIIWVYMFLFIGIVQMVIEQIAGEKKNAKKEI